MPNGVLCLNLAAMTSYCYKKAPTKFSIHWHTKKLSH